MTELVTPRPELNSESVNFINRFSQALILKYEIERTSKQRLIEKLETVVPNPLNGADSNKSLQDAKKAEAEMVERSLNVQLFPAKVQEMFMSLMELPLSDFLAQEFWLLDSEEVLRTQSQLFDASGRVIFGLGQGQIKTGSITRVLRGGQIGVQMRFGAVTEQSDKLVPTLGYTSAVLVPLKSSELI